LPTRSTHAETYGDTRRRTSWSSEYRPTGRASRGPFGPNGGWSRRSVTNRFRHRDSSRLSSSKATDCGYCKRSLVISRRSERSRIKATSEDYSGHCLERSGKCSAVGCSVPRCEGSEGECRVWCVHPQTSARPGRARGKTHLALPVLDTKIRGPTSETPRLLTRRSHFVVPG